MSGVDKFRDMGKLLIASRRRIFIFSLALTILLVVAGCASTGEIINRLSGAEDNRSSSEPAPEALQAAQAETSKAERFEEVKPPIYPKPVQAKPAQAVPPPILPVILQPVPPPKPDPKRSIHVEGPIALNIERMLLSDFIIYALGDTLKVTFFMDEFAKNRKDPVTIRMPEALPAERVFEVVLNTLEKYDLWVEEKGGALYITKPPPPQAQPSAPKANKQKSVGFGTTRPEGNEEIIQIVPVKYMSANEINSLLQLVMRESIKLTSFSKENALILSGPAPDIRDMLDFVELFDVPYIQGKKFFLLNITYWQVDDFIKQLSGILQTVGYVIANKSAEPGVVLLPIKVLSKVLVIAPDETSVKYVLDWHRKLDTPEAAGTDEKAYTYTPKFAKASEMVDSLQKLYGATPSVKAGGPPVQPQAQGQTLSPATGGGISTSKFRAVADDRRNVILIYAAPAEYRNILQYLEVLDMPPKQVLIETTIAELTLTDELQYGLEWYIKSRTSAGNSSGISEIRTLGKLGVGASSGLVYNFVADSQNFQAALNAFASANKLNIVQKPRLMAIDNQEAVFQFGQQVPITTESTTYNPNSPTTTPIVTQSVQYRDTGLILRLKPTINTDGLLTLKITYEDSTAAKTVVSGSSNPTITQKKIDTTVVASNGQSIILGGLITEQSTGGETKIPFIGDIPLIGNLFKSSSKSSDKHELIILITPTILTNTDEGTRLTNEIKQGLRWLK